MCEQCGGYHEEQAHTPQTAQPEISDEAAPEEVQRTIADVRHATSPQRQAAILQLQRQQGNHAVRRLLESAEAPPPGQVQRWQVNLPPETPCHEVADQITQTSPYSPNWARAQFEFPWSSNYRATGTAPEYTLEPVGMQVSMTPHIDVPQWSPTNPTTRTAWRTAMSNLNTHEDVHRSTATTWRGNIRTAMRAYRPSVIAQTERDAVDMGQGEFQVEHDRQLDLHQAAQDEVDANGAGCVAIINCPAPPEEPPASEEPEEAPAE